MARMSLRALLLTSLALVSWIALPGCQTDQERARELLEGAGAGTGTSARDALVEATTLDPTLREAWSRLADVELEASHWVEADAAATRAISLSDGSAHEHEVRSRALIALERWADAEPEITREIELGATEAPARTRLGKVQEHLDRPDDAMTSYRRAIELDAAAVEARLALARILIGRTETASQADAWDGDDEVRTEVRSLLEGARSPAEGTPHAEEVVALGQDLSTLDQRADALIARRAVLEQGILGILGQMGTVESPWGRDTALGRDEGSAAGALSALMGDQIGDSFGFGGLGLRGTGRGGGGEESIGLGNMGTIGHGAGGGSGQGYGSGGLGGGVGRIARDGPGATVSLSAQANGALDASTVESVVRRYSGLLRACYERSLRADPSLAGTMRLEASISAAGTVESPRASGLGDADLASCMSRALGRAAFPPSSGTTSATVSVVCAAAP